MRRIAALGLVVSAGCALAALALAAAQTEKAAKPEDQAKTGIAFPSGYRSWTHVKFMVI